MPNYYVNNEAQANGDHEVHKEGCSFHPMHSTYLGDFQSCQPAVEAARRHFRQVNGCYWCARLCHTM